MCFEKPCDIRIWLVCTNHCNSNVKGTHTYCICIYCTLWCQQHSFPQWEKAFSDWGLMVFMRTQVFPEMSCAVNDCVFIHAACLPILSTDVSLGLLNEPRYGIDQRPGRHRAAADLCTTHTIKPSLSLKVTQPPVIIPHTHWFLFFTIKFEWQPWRNYLSNPPNLESYHGCVVYICRCHWKIAKLTWGNRIQSANMRQAASWCHWLLLFPQFFLCALWPAADLGKLLKCGIFTLTFSELDYKI